MAKNLELKVVLSAIDKMTGPLRGIGQQSKRLSQGYREDMRGYNQTLKQTETALKGVRETQRKMVAAGNHNTGATIKAEQALVQRIEQTNAAIAQRKSLMDREIATIRKRQEALDRGQSQMRSGAMNMAKAGAMGYAGARFLAEGVEFDSTMSRVHALTRLDKDSEELKALRVQAMKLGATTWATSSQAAEGQAFYAMAGFTPENIMKAMPGTLDLARASGLEIGRAADIGSNILQGFGLDASEMDRVGDVLVGTFTRTNVNMEMLGDTMRYVAPIAKGLGVSLEETAAMTGILGNVGIQGTQAGTAMRAIFSRLAAGPSMATKALKQIGIKTSDKDGNLKKPIELLGEVIQKTQKMGNTERLRVLKAIAGQEAATAFMALTEKSSLEDIKRIYEEISNNQGESREVSEKMADNLAGDYQKLSSGWSDIRISIFEINNKGLRKTVQFITEIVNKIGEWVKENPRIVAVLSMAAAGGMTLLGVIGSLQLAMGAFNLVVLANPIVALIGAVIVGLTALFMYRKEIWGFFKSFAAAPRVYIDKAISFLLNLRRTIIGFLKEIPLIGPVFAAIYEYATKPFEWLMESIKWINNRWIAPQFETKNVTGFTSFLREGLAYIKDFRQSIIHLLLDIPVIGPVLGFVFEKMTFMFDIMSGLMGYVIDGLEWIGNMFVAPSFDLSGITGFFDLIRSCIDYLLDLRNNISDLLNEIPLIGPALSFVFDLLTFPFALLMQAIKKVMEMFEWVGDNWHLMQGWLVGLWDSVKGAMQPVITIFSTIIDLITEMIVGIKEFFSFEMPDWVKEIGAFFGSAYDTVAGGINSAANGVTSIIKESTDPIFGREETLIRNASIVAASPVTNTNNQTNHVEINVTAQTNASGAIIATETVNQLRSTGLLGDMR